MGNKALQQAYKKKNDEFYTMMPDIETELAHYKEQFRGMVIYCNCDDWQKSNFVKYFVLHFDDIGIERLIATGIGGRKFDMRRKGGRKFVTISKLRGNGRFESDECVALLKEADVVVTNPPFSQFVDYFRLLTTHNKQFIIMGALTAVGRQVVFEQIKAEKVRVTNNASSRTWFVTPEFDDDRGGQKLQALGNICWYTTFVDVKPYGCLDLTASYSGNEGNYTACISFECINVDRLKDIPSDYYGVMGVPITYLTHVDKRFSISDMCGGHTKNLRYMRDGKEKLAFERVLIQRTA